MEAIPSFWRVDIVTTWPNDWSYLSGFSMVCVEFFGQSLSCDSQLWNNESAPWAPGACRIELGFLFQDFTVLHNIICKNGFSKGFSKVSCKKQNRQFETAAVGKGPRASRRIDDAICASLGFETIPRRLGLSFVTAKIAKVGCEMIPYGLIQISYILKSFSLTNSMFCFNFWPELSSDLAYDRHIPIQNASYLQ